MTELRPNDVTRYLPLASQADLLVLLLEALEAGMDDAAEDFADIPDATMAETSAGLKRGDVSLKPMELGRLTGFVRKVKSDLTSPPRARQRLRLWTRPLLRWW